MRFKQPITKLIVTTILFLSSGLIYQNCGGSDTATNSNLSQKSIAPNSSAGASLGIILPGSGVAAVIAKEYYNRTYNRFFITARLGDQQLVETGAISSQWVSTGNTFTLYQNQASGTSPVCRFYIPATMSHFYTADNTECALLQSTAGFSYEGVEGYALRLAANASCPASTKAVYRAFFQAAVSSQSQHRFTASSQVLSSLVGQGWTNENTSFCALDAVTNPHDPSLNPINPGPPVPLPTPPGPSAVVCSWTWADDFSPVTPMNLRPPLRSMSCTQANVGQKQNVTDGSADWTCSCN